MGRGKRSSGNNYTSKGERPNVKRLIVKANRREYIANGNRLGNQLNAWLQGKRVVLTIENPNKKETNKRFIKVPASQVWGRNKKAKGGDK